MNIRNFQPNDLPNHDDHNLVNGDGPEFNHLSDAQMALLGTGSGGGFTTVNKYVDLTPSGVAATLGFTPDFDNNLVIVLADGRARELDVDFTHTAGVLTWTLGGGTDVPSQSVYVFEIYAGGVASAEVHEDEKDDWNGTSETVWSGISFAVNGSYPYIIIRDNVVCKIGTIGGGDDCEITGANQITFKDFPLVTRVIGFTNITPSTTDGHLIQDAGVDKTQRAKLNFENATVVDDSGNGATKVIIPLATDTVKGLAEKAIQAEVDAGTDNDRFVTSLTLASKPGIITPDATESLKGKAEIATQGEVDTGTDDTRFITPLKLANAANVGGGLELNAPFTKFVTGRVVQNGVSYADELLSSIAGFNSTHCFNIQVEAQAIMSLFIEMSSHDGTSWRTYAFTLGNIRKISVFCGISGSTRNYQDTAGFKTLGNYICTNMKATAVTDSGITLANAPGWICVTARKQPAGFSVVAMIRDIRYGYLKDF